MARGPSIYQEKIHVNVPKKWLDQLKVVAGKKYLTISEVTRQAIRDKLEKEGVKV